MARPLNELSKKTLIDYTDKASNDMLKSDQSGKKSRGDKRFHGQIKAGDKLNAKTRAGIKEEKQMKLLKEILQLDELSKKTLGSYVKKASADLTKRINSPGKFDKHKAGRRMAGILTARSKKNNVSEETEQLDEISRKLAKSYLDKSLGKHSLSNHGTKEYEKTKKGRERAENRYVVGPKYYKRMKKKD